MKPTIKIDVNTTALRKKIEDGMRKLLEQRKRKILGADASKVTAHLAGGRVGFKGPQPLLDKLAQGIKGKR